MKRLEKRQQSNNNITRPHSHIRSARGVVHSFTTEIPNRINNEVIDVIIVKEIQE